MHLQSSITYYNYSRIIKNHKDVQGDETLLGNTGIGDTDVIVSTGNYKTSQCTTLLLTHTLSNSHTPLNTTHNGQEQDSFDAGLRRSGRWWLLPLQRRWRSRSSQEPNEEYVHFHVPPPSPSISQSNNPSSRRRKSPREDPQHRQRREIRQRSRQGSRLYRRRRCKFHFHTASSILRTDSRYQDRY